MGLAYIGIKLEECDLDKNYEKAFALFKKACDGKYVRACVNLGVAYRKGEGVKRRTSQRLPSSIKKPAIAVIC